MKKAVLLNVPRKELGVITVDLNLIRRIALSLGSAILAFYMAFKHTHDLDEVENRFFYRFAIAMFYARGTIFTFQLFGWL